MPRHAQYVLDERGLNEYARSSSALKRVVLSRAELGARIAKALAPVGISSPSPGEFRASIHVEEHPVRDRYGVIFGARIVADSRDAVWAEFGRTKVNPYDGSHALGRAAKYLRAPKRVVR